ncbi:MAG: hypothetical protein M5U09_08565 [Gammaproteobacteria bacterium]|nr:hypothetical protein [Gammaproteobacteria bacterium]
MADEGTDNFVSGRNNWISDDPFQTSRSNAITGNGNTIDGGDNNSISGSDNQITSYFGDDARNNLIAGSGNSIDNGDNNFISGSGNAINGFGDIASSDDNAMMGRNNYMGRGRIQLVDHRLVQLDQRLQHKRPRPVAGTTS